MKKIFISFLCLTFGGYLFSQELTEETIPLYYDTSGYLENSNSQLSLTTTSTTASSSNEVIPTVNAEMDVNSTGGLTYTLPIEVFKGLNSFQPNLAISYNSQSGNGQAGWGWNIVGLSVITQGGTSKEIEGITQGAQMNSSDPFYLDGQRLLKVNETTYETQIFSKIQIYRNTESGYSFIVKYPDGKIAKYKELVYGQHYIDTFTDALNYEIHYTYTVSQNVPTLTKISYGGSNASNDTYKIEFTYKSRTNPVKFYKNGTEYLNSKVLDQITASSTYDGIYRKYKLTHDIMSNGNERLRRVTVENSKGDVLKPLNFFYNTSTGGVVEISAQKIVSLPSTAASLGSIAFGDFYGTGEPEVIYSYKKYKNSNESHFYNKNGSINLPKNIDGDIYSGKVLFNGKITENDQLVFTNVDYQEDLTDIINFNVYDLKNGISKKIPITMQGYEYDQTNITIDTWNCDPYWDRDECKTYTEAKARYKNRTFISGDFNNDGLIDFLIHEEAVDEKPSQWYFVEIGRDEQLNAQIRQNPVKIMGELNSVDYKDSYLIEFDGDGVPELMLVSKVYNNSTKIYEYIYSIYKIDLQTHQSTLLKSDALSDFTDNTPIYFGDFNGDGLTDFMTPQKIFKAEEKDGKYSLVKAFQDLENSSLLWWKYTSTGKVFVKEQKDYTNQRLAYIESTQRNVVKRTSVWEKLWAGKMDYYLHTEYSTNTILVTDFNGDGRSDIIMVNKIGKIKYSPDGYLVKADVQNLSNPLPLPPVVRMVNGQMVLEYPTFTSAIANKITFIKNISAKGGTDFDVSAENEKIPIGNTKISPLSLIVATTDYNQLNTYKSGAVIHDVLGQERKYLINNDDFTETYLKEVDNGSGVMQTIEYQPMVKDNNSPKDQIYTTTNLNLLYPYYTHQNQGTQYLSYKINTLFDGKALTAEYRYQNGIQQLDGKGFIGFQKTFVSDPYESELQDGRYYKKDYTVPVFWKINTFDPVMDNSLVKSTYGSLDDKAVFTESTLTYKKYDKGNHKYLILSQTETNKDLLKKVNSGKTYTYDPETLYLTEAKTTVADGFNTSETSQFTYLPDFANGSRYFSGKIKETKQILTRSGSTFTTRQESTYNTSGQLTQSKKYGNGTDAVTTAYAYDAYGNLLTETLSSAGLASLTTAYAYDATHRYAVKITSPDGLTATKSINTLGQVLSETSALGLTTSCKYDNWNNLTESTDYLGIKTTITKTALSGGKYQITMQTAGLSPASVIYDRFDRKVQTQAYALGKKVYADTEYDVYGRVIRIGEPYYEGENKQWSTVEYDYLNRPVKQTLYTGKVVTTCYEGLKVTVQDGHKKKSETLDASGHVIEHNDFGGKITYAYAPNGFLTEANYDGIAVKMEQDGWGNKIQLIDPSAGTYLYAYDNYGRLTKETAPKGVTTYAYDAYGKLTAETSEGGGISISKAYAYNNLALPVKVTGYSDGQAYSYETFYDNYYRITGKKETTPYLVSESSISYDAQGRPDQTTLKTTVKEIGFVTSAKVKNLYNSSSELVKQLDGDTNGVIWELKSLNAKGQATQMTYGNGYTLNNTYGAEFFLQNITHANAGKTAVNIDYDYNVEKGVLNSRNNHNFNKNEAFTYDDLDRLLTEKVNNVLRNEYTYDRRGRMTYNSEVGAYSYPQNNYKLDKLTFNSKGNDLKNNRGFHQIAYNMFKTPTEIYLSGKDRLSFEYGILENRSAMFYGDTETGKFSKPKRKYYSSDGSVEIVKDGNNWKVITYIDGDAYSAHYMKIDNLAGSVLQESKKYFLHRDNLQSIVAITDAANGNIAEQRFFDAWGNLTEAKDAAGQSIIQNSSLLIDRGYTGHEHLFSVGLINMNGRLYDPALRRFLEPDNFIQDLNNTQNFNRYGYVLNNPLLYTDPSGEFFLFTILNAIKDLFVNTFIKVWTQGINAWTDSNNWHSTSMAFKIDMGMFKGDFGQIISRFTWELPQTIIGHAVSSVYNLVGAVKSVSYWGGATAVETYAKKWGAFTLGSFITGNRGLYADPDNYLFQHEYGHYLQSQAMGWGYLSRVAIPSLLDASGHDNHIFNPVEQDANYRAFMYFNKHVPGFYQTKDEYEYNKIHEIQKGWNFLKNPLDPNKTKYRGYWDYNNSSVLSLLNSLKIKTSIADYAGWTIPFMGAIIVGWQNYDQYKNY